MSPYRAAVGMVCEIFSWKNLKLDTPWQNWIFLLFFNVQNSICFFLSCSYNVDQPVKKSYFQLKLKLWYQSTSVMLNLPVIITTLRTYLYGQTKFWMDAICLQHLLIEYLEKYKFLKIINTNSIFVDMKSIIQRQCQIFWVRKTEFIYSVVKR